MPTVTIDNRSIEVPAGTKVIEAAERLGIMIPRFCYHPALGSVGACRICAVTVLEGAVEGVQMSCMLDCADGMVVSTTHPDAQAMRRHVIEWLMLHHPHDCPVCDEGGHCLLQDMTESSGHVLRRYQGKKRTHRDQYLGPLVAHEMNRCIQCYRCVRYYREFSGYKDLGVTGIAHRLYFGRRADGVLESPFSGNVIDICPTGVFTDKPSRYRGRRWDYQRSRSVCIHCSLGCAIVVNARYREAVRIEARFHPAVNGHFICDRGRYGFAYAVDSERPRAARVNGEWALVEEGISAASRRLNEIEESYGPQAVACLGSSRSSLETLTALCQVSGARRWRTPAFWMEKRAAENTRMAALLLNDDLAVSQRGLEHADFVLIIGADPLNEAPMAAMALRQAQRRGAAVFVADPRSTILPFAFRHIPVRASELATWLRGILASVPRDREEEPFTGEAGEIAEAGKALADLTAQLAASQAPAIVCGTGITNSATVALTSELAARLQVRGKSARLFYLLSGPNDFAAGLLASSAASMEEVLAEIESGEIRALVVAEADPLTRFPDRLRVERCLERLDLLVTADCLRSDTALKADIFLPTQTVFEAGGGFVNQEGRLQRASMAYAGGIPVSQTGGGGHPPRVFMDAIPGSGPRPAHETLLRIAGQKRLAPFSSLIPGMPDPLPDPFPEEGVRISGGSGERLCGKEAPSANIEALPPEQIEVLLVERTFGTEALSAQSPWLEQLTPPPMVFVGPGVVEFELKEGDRLSLQTDRGAVVFSASPCPSMAERTLAVPRLRNLPWQMLGGSVLRLPRENASKVEEDS